MRFGIGRTAYYVDFYTVPLMIAACLLPNALPWRAGAA